MPNCTHQVGAGHRVCPEAGGGGPGGPGHGGPPLLVLRPQHQAALLPGLLLVAPGRHLLGPLPGGGGGDGLGGPHPGIPPGRLSPVQAQVTRGTGRLVN